MGRIRTIKPEFPQSESMGRVSREARLLFVLLWTVVDDSGRTRGNSRMLASLLFPYDDDAPGLIDEWLEELAGENCIVRYEVEDAHYVEIRKWADHQKIDKPSPSKFPDSTKGRECSAKPRECSSLDQGPRTKEGTRTGTKESDQEGGSEPAAPDAEPASPTILSFPVRGKPDEPWNLSEAKLAEYSETYPGINVRAECRRAWQWLVDNPTSAKSKIPAYLSRWLSKEQEKAGRAPRAGPTDQKPRVATKADLDNYRP